MPRAQEGHDRPKWSTVTHVIKGELQAASYDFTQIPLGSFSRLHNCGLLEVSARKVQFDLDAVHLGVAWSLFEDCVFRERGRKSIDGEWPQGSLGLRPSTYRRCTFQGVRFRLRAGFSAGQARFEECTFRRCRFEEHFSFCADYIRCRFEGRIRTAVFYCRAPSNALCDGKVNEIVGNDFTQAIISDNVAWRGNVDLSAQVWPAGYTPQEDTA
jgi:hypothetical protein